MAEKPSAVLFSMFHDRILARRMKVSTRKCVKHQHRWKFRACHHLSIYRLHDLHRMLLLDFTQRISMVDILRVNGRFYDGISVWKMMPRIASVS